MLHYVFDTFFYIISLMKTTYPFEDFNTISLYDFSLALLFVSITVTIFVNNNTKED